MLGEASQLTHLSAHLCQPVYPGEGVNIRKGVIVDSPDHSPLPPPRVLLGKASKVAFDRCSCLRHLVFVRSQYQCIIGYRVYKGPKW
jgi:hypothetical protein